MYFFIFKKIFCNIMNFRMLNNNFINSNVGFVMSSFLWYFIISIYFFQNFIISIYFFQNFIISIYFFPNLNQINNIKFLKIKIINLIDLMIQLNCMIMFSVSLRRNTRINRKLVSK